MLGEYKTLKSNVDALDVYKNAVNNIKVQLEEMDGKEDLPANCTGLPGYEIDSFGDGVKCKYYDN